MVEMLPQGRAEVTQEPELHLSSAPALGEVHLRPLEAVRGDSLQGWGCPRRGEVTRVPAGLGAVHSVAAGWLPPVGLGNGSAAPPHPRLPACPPSPSPCPGSRGAALLC